MVKKTKTQTELVALKKTVERIEADLNAERQQSCSHRQVDVKVWLHNTDKDRICSMQMYRSFGKCWIAKITCSICGKELNTGKLSVEVGCDE